MTTSPSEADWPKCGFCGEPVAPEEELFLDGGVAFHKRFCADDYLKDFNEVVSPKHYNLGDIECIDAIEASMSPEEFRGYLKGAVLKYLWRYQYKGKPKQDLEKAEWYLKKLKGKVQ